MQWTFCNIRKIAHPSRKMLWKHQLLYVYCLPWVKCCARRPTNMDSNVVIVLLYRWETSAQRGQTAHSLLFSYCESELLFRTGGVCSNVHTLNVTAPACLNMSAWMNGTWVCLYRKGGLFLFSQLQQFPPLEILEQLVRNIQINWFYPKEKIEIQSL